MMSCMDELNDQGRPYWRFTEFAVALLKADATQGSHLAALVKAFLAKQTMVDAGICNKTASTTSDGGSNMKSLVDALTGEVGCTSLLASLKSPIASACQPHLINTVSRSINPGKNFNNYRIAEYEALGFAKPNITVSNVLSYFLAGTTLLKKSSPTRRIFDSLCRCSGLSPVTLRNPAPTRWLSIVSYLILVIKFKHPYDELWKHKQLKEKHRVHAIPPRIWALAETILAELLPLFRLIHRLQRDNNRYLLSDAIFDTGQAIILYQRRLDQYRQVGQTPDLDPSIASLRVHLVDNIVRSFRKNYDFLFEYIPDKEHYIFALLLDPRYSDLSILGRVILYQYENREDIPEEELVPVRSLHKKYVDRLLDVACELQTDDEQASAEAPRSGLKRKQASFTSVDFSATEPLPASGAGFREKAQRQLNAVIKYGEGAGPHQFPLHFWPSFKEVAPDLFKLAEVFVGINKSQVKVEGLFSVTGYVTMDRRSRTGVDRLDDVCYIWQNSEPKTRTAARNQSIDFTANVPEEETTWDPTFRIQALDQEQAESENGLLADFDVDEFGFAHLPGGDHMDRIFDPVSLPHLPDLDDEELEAMGDPAFTDLDNLFPVSDD